jgi:hypothetical protein
VEDAQASPLPQALPLVQHGWLLAPQVVQVPAAQTVVVAVQAIPAQQGWVTAPQVAHVPFAQTEPLAQMVPQQGCVAIPHATQVLFWQTALV